MSSKYEDLKSQVEYCLREMPETRDSDITLLIAIWQLFHGIDDVVSIGQLYELPREDNVKRIRAALNAEGKYYPTNWQVAKQRGLKEDEWRQALGYPAKNETMQSTKVASWMDPTGGVAVR